MKKRSTKKKQSAKTAAKTSRNTASHKARVRAAAALVATPSRRSARKPRLNDALKISAIKTITAGEEIAAIEVGSVTVAEVTALSRHKFQVGQSVFYTSSPISRPGASGSYKVVRLLPSDGDDYQYRIKNPGEAFERVAKESQLEVDH